MALVAEGLLVRICGEYLATGNLTGQQPTSYCSDGAATREEAFLFALRLGWELRPR